MIMVDFADFNTIIKQKNCFCCCCTLRKFFQHSSYDLLMVLLRPWQMEMRPINCPLKCLRVPLLRHAPMDIYFFMVERNFVSVTITEKPRTRKPDVTGHVVPPVAAASSMAKAHMHAYCNMHIHA